MVILHSFQSSFGNVEVSIRHSSRYADFSHLMGPVHTTAARVVAPIFAKAVVVGKSVLNAERIGRSGMGVMPERVSKKPP